MNVAVEDEKKRLPQCGSNGYLVDQLPVTININCWAEHTLKYQGKRKLQGVAVQKDGTVRIENLDQIVTQLDVDVETRFETFPRSSKLVFSSQIHLTMLLIRNKTDPSISFPSDSFNLLLSSSLQNDQSFGRVAAESDSHLDYYLLGSEALSVKKDTGQLIVRNITDIQLNPEPRIVTLIAANRVGMSSVQVRIMQKQVKSLHSDQD